MPTNLFVGLNRVIRAGGKRRVEHKSVRIVVDAKWGAPDFHNKARDAIRSAYPSWLLTGYAPTRDQG